MIRLTRLVSPNSFTVNCLRCRKFFMSNGLEASRFFHMRNTMTLKKRKLSMLIENVNFCKFSTESCRISGGLKNSGIVDEETEDKAEDKGESSDDDDLDGINYFDDDYDNDVHRNQKREKIFQEIANGNSDILKKLKLLEFEIAVLQQQRNKIPVNLTKTHWEELLKTPVSRRVQLLKFFSLNESLRASQSKLKLIKREKALKIRSSAGFHHYGLTGHTMFLRIYNKSLKKLLLHRQMRAKLKILFDCSYQEFMNEKCVKLVAKQIHMSLTEAQLHRYPCLPAFCNLNPNDFLGKIITKYVKPMYNETFYCDVSANSVLDNYPKEKLLYLSPHAPNDLMEFSKDKIYIIGCYVDRGQTVRASLAKAKENNIKVARLPLDQYLCWKQGNKCLPLNVVLKILLDMSFYNDWNKAFKNIAGRLKNDGYTKRKYCISNAVEEL